MRLKTLLLASLLVSGCQQDLHNKKENSISSVQSDESLISRVNSDEIASEDEQLINYQTKKINNSLWDNIRTNLAFADDTHTSVEKQLNLYLAHRNNLIDTLDKAQPYLYWIVEQIQQRNMPTDIVFMPIVESHFNPYATSSAHAAGLWQIVPVTARNYGLKENTWYDGRRDVVASTNAALDILQHLNNMFHGDWLLTIAAYNCGEGCVLNAVNNNRRQGKPTDFWSLNLPTETRRYVPKLLALSHIIKNNQQYHLMLPVTDNKRALARVDVNKQMRLSQAADLAGITLSELKQFNPGYKRNATAPKGPHYIMLPKRHESQFRTALHANKILPVLMTRYYTVKSGDALSTVADNLGINIADLRRLNNLKNNNIRIGQKLKFLTSATVTYQVKRGDSLTSIAKQHNLKIEDIKHWNGLVKNQLRPGEKITLYLTDNNAS